MFQDGPCGHDGPAKAGSRDAVPRTPANAGHPEGTRARTLFLPTISSTFHSLSKVLFIFPSRYLFAIGLLAVFSLGWNLPPDLGLDSQTTRLLESDSWSGAGAPYGAITLSGMPTIPGGFRARPATENASLDYNSEASLGFSSWALPVSLAATQRIPVGFFSSA